MLNVEYWMLNAQQCFRGMVERDRDIEERRRDEMAEKLVVYKRAVANCETTARVMREEEARLEEVYNRLEEEAERADRVAAIAEEEARRFWIILFYSEFFCFALKFHCHKILKPSTLFLLSDSERLFSVLLWAFLAMKYWIPQFLFCSQIQRDFSVLLWTFLVMKYWTPQLWISGLNKSLYRKKLLMLLCAGRRRFKIRHQILFKLQMLTNFNPTDIKQIKIIFRQGIERSRGDRGEMVLVQTTKMSNFEILCTIYVLCFLSSSRNISWSHVYQTRSQRQLYFIPKMKFWTNHIKLTRINWIAQAGKLLNFYCKKP